MAFSGYYRGKRVLVTGHTGFKGSWLAQWLVDLGAEVAGFSIDVPSEPSHFEVLGLKSRLKDYRGDIREPASLKKTFEEFKPEVVFHLAAQALVRDSYDNPADTFATNVMGTAHVLDAVRATPSVKCGIVVTSDKVYENIEQEYGYSETDRLGGKDPYSASKAATEILFSSWFRSFFDKLGAAQLSSVRAGNVIGGGDWAKDRIVPDAVRSWSRGQDLLVRNPQSTRPWQHVLEPLSGYLWIAARLAQKEPGLNGEAFNFGPLSSATQTVEDLVCEMKKTWGRAAWKQDARSSMEKKEATLLQVNCEKAQAKLGWTATLSFQETVKMTADWYKVHSENGKSAQLTSRQIAEYTNQARQRGQSWAT